MCWTWIYAKEAFLALDIALTEKIKFVFIKNKLISSSQSGFKPCDSCINQLLSITHEIYSSFHEGLGVRSVFLDISKVFDKVWYDAIIFKLNQNGISGNDISPFALIFKCKKTTSSS